MKNTVKEILPEFEVTIISKLNYTMIKVVKARNEYEAVLEFSDLIASDMGLYFGNDEYRVISVVRID